jgi:hypothetical protein
LAAALISFVDDYEGLFPNEFFPEELVMRLLGDLNGVRIGAITIPTLLQADALSRAQSFFEAVVAAHAAVRLLARGRDRRAFPRYKGTLQERVLRGASIAPFAPTVSRGGDPLGDTYHYLANLAIGLTFLPSQPLNWCAAGMFGIGPELMFTIRERLFGNRLFYGNHARIDRMGLAHGLVLARWGTGAGRAHRGALE